MKTVWDLLRDVALKDNQITEEEVNVLDNIMENLTNYMDLFDKAIEDGIITYAEKEELIEARNKIWEEAYEKSLQDKVITQDEQNIMFTLIKILRYLDEEEDQSYF